ncbi:nuclear transport factor 2 family protein [Bacteroides sp. GD17]|uniref:YybH family protein n=1 Tax=Bacteroides sp. GD17 TaxID=3139826 RepID=UPI0025F3518E|nr:nuclear transport factor 2 family protein [uncultured Bacteroides sp.]
MIISLEQKALAATDGMAFVELSDTDVVYFDPSLEKKIEGLQQLRAHYENMSNTAPADSFEMIRPIVQVTQNIAILTFNLDSYEAGNVTKWNCTEVYRRNLDNQWRIIQTHWSLVKPIE